jgi:glycosyltransferase involved in cell wall biosynthesis
MCCQKPVIANAVDGVKEIISEGKTGFLIKPYDYEMTAKKTVDLIKNEELRFDMGKKAKESIGEEFDLNYVVEQHQNLYNAQ